MKKVAALPHPEVQIERMLTIWGVVVILWSIFRAYMQPPVWFSEFVAKPTIFLLPVLFYIRRFERLRGSFLEAVGFPKKKVLLEVLLAVCLLLVVVGSGIFLLVTSRGAKIMQLQSLNVNKMGYLIVLALATSFSEEIVGRGFLFNYLEKYSGKFVLSLFISASLFFVLYLPGALTAKVAGQALFFNLLLNFLLSFMTTILFYLRRNILSSIAFHTGVLLWFEILLGV